MRQVEGKIQDRVAVREAPDAFVPGLRCRAGECVRCYVSPALARHLSAVLATT